MPSFNLSEPMNIQDVHKAPNLPGLYVWYARFHVGKADWHSDYAGGNKAAQTTFLRALQEHSMKFGQQEMSVSAIANFSTIWKGALEEDAVSRWRNGFDEDAPNEQPSSLSLVLAQNNAREALVNMVSSCFPVFNSPLYLGLAVDQTLKVRLSQHRNTFIDLWERYSRDKDLISRIDKPKNFSERAIKLGFSPEDLFCYALCVDRLPEENLSAEELRAVIVSSEWILNRWATPILGRQ